jgi:predicted transcriptional regulator
MRCEKIVKILPVIRANIARELIKNYNLSQERVAEILGITQSAVSQYTKNIRGKELKAIEETLILESGDEFKKAVKEMCEEIMKGESFESVICKFCKKFI